jgi:hypothetical protein
MMIDSLSTELIGHKQPTLADIEQLRHELLNHAALPAQPQTIPATRLFAEVDPVWTGNRITSARLPRVASSP